MPSSPNNHQGGARSVPPPSNEVLPRGIGPIDVPNCNDVLSGRGGRINAHAGNVQFRTIIAGMKSTYLSPKTRKLEKAHIANDIVRRIRRLDPPGRFLKEDKDGTWWDIGDEKARKKVGQALREDAPDIRPQLGSGVEGGGAAVVAQAVAEDMARRQAMMGADGGNNDYGGDADADADADQLDAALLAAAGADDDFGFGRISGTTGLLPGPPPSQAGPYRTPSFTSGRGMSPRGTAGGRGHPASSPSYMYPPYDPSLRQSQTQHQGWYAHPSGGAGGGGGVHPTQQTGGSGTDRNPSQMTFGSNTFHPTDSVMTADVSDISGLSLNVGADIPPGAGAATAAGASGSSGGSKGELRFSHRSAWQHNQLRNRAARYAHHPSRYAQHLQSQQHHQHHGGQHHQLPQPSPIKGPDRTSGVSKMSELSMSMSIGGLTGSDPMGKLARSLSIPGFNSRDLMSLGESSFHALLEDEALANFDAELRRANPTLGDAGAGEAAGGLAHVSEETGRSSSAGNSEGGGKPPARESASSKGSSSAAKSSGQHSAAEVSQRSNISMAEVSMASVRSSASSWMRNYRGQDPSGEHEIEGTDMVNPWLAMEGHPDSGGDQFSTGGSQLSILSEISTELMALDLADGSLIGARR